MVEKIEKETEQFGQKIPDELVKEPEEKTPTAEERIATLQEERDKLTKERDEAQRGLSTAHSKLTQKDKEIRGKNAVNTRIDGLEETIRILAGMQDEKLGELEDGKKTDYLGKFDDIVKGQKTAREQEIAKAQQEEDFKHRDELWSKAKEFGTYEDNDNVAEIYDALMEGKTYKAERILGKLGKTKPTDTKGDKVESEEERFTKRLEEEKRKWMEEKGMLVSETGGPSGASPNDEQIRKNYRENSDDPKAYREYHAYLTRTGQSHK